MFHSIEESKGSYSETGHALKGEARVSTNKAVRDSLATVITHKQALCGEQLAIEDGTVGEDEERKKTNKRPKKELSDGEKQEKAFDNNMKQILA